MSNADRGKCEATSEGLFNAPLSCDLLSGHSGRHHDPHSGTDWSPISPPGAGTVEYAVQYDYGLGDTGLMPQRTRADAEEKAAAWHQLNARVVQRTVTEWHPVEVTSSPPVSGVDGKDEENQ